MKKIIIDCHAHVGPYYNFFNPNNDILGMLAGMDNVGIDITCITPNLSLTYDITEGNKHMHQLVNNYPDRVKGYVGINPHYHEHPIYKKLNIAVEVSV